MAAKLFFLPYQSATVSGIAQPGAKAYFYTTGTTTRQPTYTTSALNVQHSFPVVANSSGKFPNIYLNDAITYRLDLKTKTGTLIASIDPYIPGTAPDAESLGAYQDAAESAAVESAASATAAAASATAAATSATAAAAAEDAVIDALAGTPIDGAMITVASRALLAALDTAYPAYLTEEGREGFFVYNSDDLSAFVTVDTEQGVYVAPSSDTDGSSGAWVRVSDIWTPLMFGAQDATGTPMGADEVVYDCSAALACMWAVAKLVERDVTLDFSRGQGWGVTETFDLDTETVEGSAWWNNRTYHILAGRFVAMSEMDAIISCTGKIFECSGLWILQGGVDSEVPDGYLDFKAKDGLVYNDSAGSHFGSVHGLNLRRYLVRADTDGNSIPIGFDEVKAVSCGSRGETAALGWGGDYAGGIYDNSTGDGTYAGYSGTDNQRMTITVALPVGVSATDIAVGDFGIANDDELCIVDEIVSVVGQNVTLRVYPWLSATTGTFYSCHGGAVDLAGVNTANSYFSIIYALSSGTAFRCHPTFGPKVKTLLAESCAIGIGLGDHLGSMIGLDVSHAHLESNVISIAAARFSGNAVISAISHLEAETVEQTMPQSYNGTVFTAISKLFTIPGLKLTTPNANTFGGNRSRAPTNKEADNTNLVYDNRWPNPIPAYIAGGRTVYINADQFAARRGNMRHVVLGPFYGPGTNDAPTGTINVALNGEAQNATVTINGGAGPAGFTSSDGPITIDAIFEPTESGTGGNWKLFQR